jgi:uncharacterized membrane protein
MLPIHVIAGLLALAAGAVALFVVKGSRLHRKSGLVFVIAMLTMASTGALMAGLKPDRGTMLGGVLTFYMVCTGFLTVRGTFEQNRRLMIWLMLMAIAVGVFDYAFGIAASNSPTHKFDGYPPALYFVFGSIAWLGAFGDARTLIARRLEGSKRMVRHIGRMGFAMWMATTSFFLGQAKVFPEPLRHAVALRAIPVVLVIAVVGYWILRTLIMRERAVRMPFGNTETSR